MNGIIYKLNVGDEFYIGSTRRKMCERLASHRQDAIKFPNRLLYKNINNNWKDTSIEKLEEKTFENREEMEKVEKEFIKSLNPTLNTNKGNSKRYDHNKYMNNEKHKTYMRDYMKAKVQNNKNN